MKRYRNILNNILSLARYNMRIVFGGKFVYFVLAAFLFYLVLGIIQALDENYIMINDIYGLLILPAILLSNYILQN